MRRFRIVFWDVLPSKIIVDRRFRGMCYLHHHYFTRQYIPEDNSELHTRRRENLKSHECEGNEYSNLMRTLYSITHRLKYIYWCEYTYTLVTCTEQKLKCINGICKTEIFIFRINHEIRLVQLHFKRVSNFVHSFIDYCKISLNYTKALFYFKLTVMTSVFHRNIDRLFPTSSGSKAVACLTQFSQVPRLYTAGIGQMNFHTHARTHTHTHTLYI
jgi:hypothetical protein